MGETVLKKQEFKKCFLVFLMLAFILAAVSSCTGDVNQVPVSSEINTSISSSEYVTSETSGSSIADKVIASGIEIADNDDTVKAFKVYRDDLEIDGVLYLPEGTGPFPVCFIAQGLGAPYYGYEDIAVKLASEGIAAALMNFTAKDGTFSVITEAEDLMAVIDGITSLPYIYCRNTFLWGHSFGGLVVSYAGCEYFPYYSEKIKGLILVEPSFDFQERYRKSYPSVSDIPDDVQYGKIFYEDLLSFDIYEKMPAFGGKVVIFAGTEKGSIGFGKPEIFEKAQKSFSNAGITPVEGADHYFGDTGREAMIRGAIDFIKNNME